MSVRRYLDENVPSAIAVSLKKRDVNVLTVHEDGMDAEPDDILIDRATSLARVGFSLDKDFLRHAHRRQLDGVPFSGVIFARLTRVSIGDIVRDLELIAKCGTEEEHVNRVVYLPL